MKKIITQTTAVVALTVAATAVSAQSGMDADGNGLLSYDELQLAYPEVTQDEFAAIDINADGGIDAEEMQAAQTSGQLPIVK